MPEVAAKAGGESIVVPWTHVLVRDGNGEVVIGEVRPSRRGQSAGVVDVDELDDVSAPVPLLLSPDDVLVVEVVDELSDAGFDALP